MSSHHATAPLEKKLFTPGVLFLLFLIANGAFFGLKRFIFGLESVTNLDNYYPWGIWIAVDVASGVALAAGGFTTAALVEIFHRDRYHVLLRPALLTAMLGYSFVAFGILFDVGRYYNIWHPMVPSMWSGHSALFEVAMCVTIYLHVLYVEFIPVVVERFQGRISLPGIMAKLNNFAESLLKLADKTFVRYMFFFSIAGVVLSCMHQSSLGILMVLAPTKMDPLWYTPILPLLFLFSAFAVGFPMVIVESIWASKSFGREPEMDVLGPFSKFIIFTLGIYMSAKVMDLVVRDQFARLFSGEKLGTMLLIEILFGVFIPFVMLLSSTVRKKPGLLFTAAILVVLGVAFNRINVFITAFHPPYATTSYFPSFGEISVTVGLIAALMFLYRLLVTIFPILPVPHKGAPHGA